MLEIQERREFHERESEFGRKVQAMLYGFVIGDCLGFPVESKRPRGTYRLRDMISTHVSQPKGLWSDDTTLTLCLAESIAEHKGLLSLMKKFLQYESRGYLSPLGFAFGMGKTSRQAIRRFRDGLPLEDCGGKSENDNGNGALMRISPIMLVLEEGFSYQERFEIIKMYTELTHGHARSIVASVVYVELLRKLWQGKEFRSSWREVYEDFMAEVDKESAYYEEFREHFSRVFADNFFDLVEDVIESRGYVMTTLEASIWCVGQSSSYEESVLRAVNLGGDTDTIGAITGSIAGLIYGLESIPKKWLEGIYRRDMIDEVIEKYISYFEKKLESENLE